MKKLSVVLLSWKRPNNIKIILDNLYKSSAVGEILLWNNNPELTLNYSHPKLDLVNSPKNYGTLMRYCLAGTASNKHIMFQDDDLYHTPEQIEKMFNDYLEDTSCIYGPLGRTLENYKYIKKNTYGLVDIIIGRTTMFHKKYLYRFFEYLGDYSGVFEDDILFSLAMKTKHKTVDIGEVNELPNHDALSKRANHLDGRQTMVDYCLKTIPGIKDIINSNDT